MLRCRLRFLAGAVLLMPVCACAVDEELKRMSEAPLPEPLSSDQIELVHGVTYVYRGADPLQLDLARPKIGRGPYPAVVCIHGGGWKGGSRDAPEIHEIVQYLASYGYVAVTPSYRLAPDHPFPAAVADVRDCVRWLRRNARLYGIDPQHIGAMGISAGGHLACLVGLASDNDRFGPDDGVVGTESARVQAVVNCFGPTDLAAKDWSQQVIHQNLIPLMQGRADDKPEAYRKASPIIYVSPDDPPILTFHGTADPIVPVSQATNLHKRLQEAGVRNRLITIQGQGHGWVGPLRTATKRAMVVFFNEHLKGTKPASQPATRAEAAGASALIGRRQGGHLPGQDSTQALTGGKRLVGPSHQCRHSSLAGVSAPR